MMELVQEGRLHGDNPSDAESDDPLERLAAETPDVDDEAPGEQPAPAAQRDEPEPDAGTKSQVRTYVVLEEHTFEDADEKYTVELGRFDARNATNALRRAFKALITDDEPHTLIAVTATQWRKTPVQRSHRQIESVQIGG
jgi:hypothetical protein